MNIKQALLAEFEHETNTTRNFLEQLDENILGYQPHEKSMSTQDLANHISNIPTWMVVTLNQPELDFATANFERPILTTKDQIVETFNKNVEAAKESLKNINPENLAENWSLKNGDKTFFTRPKAAVLRAMVYNHLIHHRAQLGVYLRMNDAKVPASYGDSADDKSMFD